MSVLNSLISPADHSIRSFHLFSLPFLFFQTKQIFHSFIYDRAHLKWDFDYKDKILSFCAERARIYYTRKEIVERVYSFFLAFLESLQLNLWIKVCVLICSLIWMDEYLLGEGRSIFLRLKNWNRKRRVCKS